MPRKNNAIVVNSHHPSNNSASNTQRLDKWLWAARFFKTRSLAGEAISGGKVQVNDQRVKPAKLVQAGVKIRIRRASMEWEVILQGISRRRRPASEAMLLYRETLESLTNRESKEKQQRMEKTERLRGMGRPTKRDRRRLSELTGR